MDKEHARITHANAVVALECYHSLAATIIGRCIYVRTGVCIAYTHNIYASHYLPSH